MSFQKSGTISGGAQNIQLTANSLLPGEVDIFIDSIDWEMTINSTNFDLGTTSPHKVYVTYGTPSGSVTTEMRVDWVCDEADGESSKGNS